MILYSKEIKIGGINMLNENFTSQYCTFKSKIIGESNNSIVYIPNKELYVPDKKIILLNKQTDICESFLF